MDGDFWGSPHQLAASADGRTVYLTRTYGHGASKGAGIVTLARNAQTGTLRETGTLKIGTLSGGVLGATALPTENGHSLYATEAGYPGYGIDAIRLFRPRT